MTFILSFYEKNRMLSVSWSIRKPISMISHNNNNRIIIYTIFFKFLKICICHCHTCFYILCISTFFYSVHILIKYKWNMCTPYMYKLKCFVISCCYFRIFSFIIKCFVIICICLTIIRISSEILKILSSYHAESL